MTTSLIRPVLTAALALSVGLSLAACGGGGTAPASGAASGASTSQSGAASSSTEEDGATKEDLKLALQTVKDTLAKNPELTQIYLANDVDKPTEKYGMLVVPYAHSESTEKLTTSVVEIEGGKYKIGALAKESQKTWEIDQDGKISEKTDK